jgi:hypothetical protein
MLELPDKFKQALGNGVRTSLYPLVKIYKGVRIDDPEGNEGTAWEDAESINLSIKETNISGSAYKPLLLNAPAIKSSADIINNKYTISTVSLSISNAPFQGKIFSDDIQSILNAVCQVYYCANGIDSIEDCLLVYTGTIRRFSQSAETIQLQLEDLTEQMLSTKIPVSLVEEESPYPMVYGYVDKSPVIKKSLSQNYLLEPELTEFHIDKKGREIGGLWDEFNIGDYGSPLLTESHRLVAFGYVKQVGTLSVYDDNFLPIPQYLDYEKPWSYYVDGITDDEDPNYNKIEINGTDVYDFHEATPSSSASIKLNAEALVRVDDLLGIPSRVFRPLDKLICSNMDFDNNAPNPIFENQNRIYGFVGYDGFAPSSTATTSLFNFSPWAKDNEAFYFAGYYWDNWNGLLGHPKQWWMPTDCYNNHNNSGTTVITDIDDNWKTEYPETKGFYPINNLQDNTFDRGIWIIGQNEDAESGFAYVKLQLKDNIASFPCSSKITYDAQYHSFNGMEDGGVQSNYFAYGATLFTDDNGLDYHNPNGNTGMTAQDLANTLDFPNIPNQNESWQNITYTYPEQIGTIDTVQISNGYEELETFNNTNAFDHINFGMLKIPQFNSGDDDYCHCSAMLFNFYLLQDAVVDQPLDKDFYADVIGRSVDIFCTVEETGFHSPGAHTITLKFTEHFNVVIENYLIGDSVSIYDVSGFGGETATIDSINEQNTTITLLKESSMINVIVGNVYIFDTTKSTIRKPEEIMKDILEDELGYIGKINIPNDFNLFKDQYKINNDFTLNEQKETKEVFEGLFQSSLAIPSFNASGEFKLIPIHQLEIDNYTEYQANGTQAINSNTIDNQHILKYSFNLTKLEDVKNQVNVKYKINYASGDFDKETGYIFYDVDGNYYHSYDEQSQQNYPDDPTKHYSLDYYGLKPNEAQLEVETEYIRNLESARKLQKRLLNWYANQHLIVKIDLPVSYMNLEVGDYIHFDELVGGKKAFGYDYTRHYNKNGQVAYKYFFITKISKSLSKISIEGIQVHRGEYGFWDSWDEEYGDTGGNDGDNDFDIEEDEDGEIIEEEEFYVNLSWENITPEPEMANNNINDNPTVIISTNLIGEFDYKIWITVNSEPFEYGNPQTPAIMSSAPPGFEMSGDYITVIENYYTNNNGQTQGGLLQLQSDFSPPDLDEDGNPHGNIEGYIELTHPDLNQSAILGFFQDYTLGPEEPARLGDWNDDGTLNVLDVVGISSQIILTGQSAGGTGTWSDENSNNYSPQSDINDDGVVNILDVVMLVNIILSGEG